MQLCLLFINIFSYNLGINFAAENLKSLILTFALVNHKVDIDTAVSLARLETQFQVNVLFFLLFNSLVGDLYVSLVDAT